MKVFRLNHFKCLFLLALLACSGKETLVPSNASQVVACFDAPSTANVGTAVLFNSSCSKNVTSYLWDFGGQGTSTSANPSFTFTSSGSVAVKLTVSSATGQNSLTKSINIQAAANNCIAHNNQTINTNQTWKTGETHCVYGQLTIDGATLTIEPGVTVRLYKTSDIIVGYSSSNSVLVANGTANQPILFTSAEATPAIGDWINIGFYSGAGSANKLSYCTFEYGGSQAYSSFNETVGMVEVKEKGTVSIDHCTFRKGLSHAAKTDMTSGFTSFTFNTISDVGSYAISTYAMQAHTIGTNNAITNKGVLLQNSYVDKDVTWNALSCPYFSDGGFAVGSTAGNTLTLAPGVEIRFLTSASLDVGTYGSIGKLLAIGTSTQKISFTSAQTTPAPGDWDGLFFGRGTMGGTQLSNVAIKYANGDATQFGALTIQNSSVNMDACEIGSCKGMGIRMDTDYNPKFASFTNNILNTPNGYPVNLLSANIGSIGAGNVFTSSYPVYIVADKLDGANIIWRNVGVPYLIQGNIMVGAYITTGLTIEAGCVLKFNAGSGMTIFNQNTGTFAAVGTASQPIIFTSSKPTGSQAPGDWDGVEIYGLTQAGSVMDNCKFMYGGGRYANVTVWGLAAGLPTIKNCTFSQSSEYGLKIIQSSPTLSNNTYSANTLGDVGNF